MFQHVIQLIDHRQSIGQCHRMKIVIISFCFVMLLFFNKLILLNSNKQNAYLSELKYQIHFFYLYSLPSYKEKKHYFCGENLSRAKYLSSIYTYVQLDLFYCRMIHLFIRTKQKKTLLNICLFIFIVLFL